MRDSGELKRSAARHFTSSVLPTPVEPVKRKETGFLFGEIPTRLRLIAAATAATAWTCVPTVWKFALNVPRSASNAAPARTALSSAVIAVFAATALRFAPIAAWSAADAPISAIPAAFVAIAL